MSGHRPILVLAAVLLAGCGASGSGSADFEGEKGDVAQVIEDLRAAGEKGDAAEICGRLLARELVDQVAAGRETCTDELSKALDDADGYRLDVEAVTIAGPSATARVKNGDGREQTIRLVKSGNAWKISELG